MIQYKKRDYALFVLFMEQNLRYKLEEFEGPLDLLLQMIQNAELDISEISLASVADQFVQYIQQHPEISGQELTDFLIVATQLLLLKSKLLLPYAEFDEEIEPESLEKQLKLYRRFIEAAKQLEAKIAQRYFMYTKKKSAIKQEARFRAPDGLVLDQLKLSMYDVLKRLEPIIILPESVMEKTVTLQEKMRDIQSLLKSAKGLSFRSILIESRSKMEKVVSFLALLELVKQGEINTKQDKAFGDILIDKTQ